MIFGKDKLFAPAALQPAGSSAYLGDIRGVPFKG
jgi:hypothetical protein